MRQLFLDLDGVFADFNKGVKAITGKEPSSLPSWRLWSSINKKEDFWISLEPFEYASSFIDSLKKYNPIILTGLPSSKKDLVSEQKRKWVEEHLGEYEVITCASKDKHLFMKNKWDVLVDDNLKNCNNWEVNGGVAVLFDYPKHSIEHIIHEIEIMMT